MARKKKSEKQAQKDKIKAMFPDAIEFMHLALTDKIPTKNNKKQVATVGQKLDIAKIVVDQVIGRPAQGSPMGGDTERPEINTLEVIKSYEGGDLPNDVAPDGLIPVEEPTPGPQTREEWLKAVEEEAMAAVDEPTKVD
jgi:hypothetical protein